MYFVIITKGARNTILDMKNQCYVLQLLLGRYKEILKSNLYIYIEISFQTHIKKNNFAMSFQNYFLFFIF